jgi:hypothetical protein
MNAFSQIEERGSSVDIAFLSGGIWEAMITTATGLVTAICSVSCCKWFEHLSTSRLEDMGCAVSILTEKTRRAAPADGESRFMEEPSPAEYAGETAAGSTEDIQRARMRGKNKESA